MDKPLINREISWLSFNERVLQEAQDPSVPLIERFRFLGIFSNNRDEFFRVRVATVKRMVALEGKKQVEGLFKPREILQEIQRITIKQQRTFETTYRALVKELEGEQIFIVNEEQLNKRQATFVKAYFEKEVRSELVPIMLDRKELFPTLRGGGLYLFIRLIVKNAAGERKNKFAVLAIPEGLPRFVVLPGSADEKFVILLDDIIRHRLHEIFAIFDFEELHSYAFKISRDAELDLDDDISSSLMDKMRKGLEKRKIGDPVRLVYDGEMPEDMLNLLLKRIKLKEGENIISGGRYHNFKDFIGFPDVGRKDLVYEKWAPLKHPVLRKEKSVIKAVLEQDVFLHYPYQSFHYIVDLLREAAIHPKVKAIKVNLYRVAKNSHIANALINAVKNGKKVTAVIELQARFDEKNNLYWSDKLEDQGVKLIFGVPGLKVHSKLLLITFKDGKRLERIAHIGTGNFNEKTAGIYSDCSLLTRDKRLSIEVERVFDFFEHNYQRKMFKNLLVSPYGTRRKFLNLIGKEIVNAKAGKEAYITIKLNNLVDTVMIKKLYEASQAGVQVNLIIRGICSLVPGVKGVSENIHVVSIVDRFLEHARVLVFCNGGNELMYITSADWMTRNLDRRVEVSAPIFDEGVKATIRELLDMQLKDNVKARILDKKNLNKYKSQEGEAPFSAQYETYQYFKRLNS